MKPGFKNTGLCRAAGALALSVVLLSGCSTASLESARYNFYAGRLQEADNKLESGKVPEKNKVLFLMERGTIRQALGQYEESSRDYIDASDQLDIFETYSVSKGAASWVVNDTVQDFKGTPFERTLLHAFTAKNHLARADWDNAAVEARRIIRTLIPEGRRDYPDDPYSRYMAGFCLEMIDDDSNASLQYRKASELLPDLVISEATGHLFPAPTNAPVGTTARDKAPPSGDKVWGHELVCFVGIGRSPRETDTWDEQWKAGSPMYAEIYHNDKLLGRSYNLADTVEMAFTTEQIEAVRKAVKTVGRVVLKEVIAESVEHSTNEDVGDLVRFVLIGLLEQPDVRRWETLPRWLQVARVPCPPGIQEYDVVFKNAYGGVMSRKHVTGPIARRRNTYVSFCRDLPVSASSPILPK